MASPRTITSWLDRLPRAHVRLGRSAVPTYLLCGIVGYVVAQLGVLSLCALTGRSLLVGFALGPVSAAITIVTSLIRRAATGSEQIVLQEQLTVVLGLVTLGLASVGLPVLQYLDLLSTGLALFLAFGRVGCFLGGCCYGVPCELGVVYPRECVRYLGPRVRRLPVQLLDSGLWVAVFIVSASLVIVAEQPGAATSFCLVAYGLGRLPLESLRDDPRLHLLGLSEGRWFAVGGVLVGLALAASVRQWPIREMVVVGVAGGLVFVAFSTRRWWLDLSSDRPPDDAAAQLDRLAETCAGSTAERVHTTQIGPISIGLRRLRADYFELSIFRDGSMLSRAEAEVWLDALLGFDDTIDHEALTQSPKGVWITMTRATDRP